MDILVWGGVIAVLLYSIDAVDLGNLSRLFSGNESTSLFVHDLLRPDFSQWKMFVAKMWETVQIALWGTALAVLFGIPLGLAAARNMAPALSPLASASPRFWSAIISRIGFR